MSAQTQIAQAPANVQEIIANCETCQRVGRQCWSHRMLGKLVPCLTCARSVKVGDNAICANCVASEGQPEYAENTTALQAGHAAAREARETNPRAYYGTDLGIATDGCSCTPSNGPDCVSCH